MVIGHWYRVGLVKIKNKGGIRIDKKAVRKEN
jgi:hypothetical protein